AGKVVIDTNIYYPDHDGHAAERDGKGTTTSEPLQAHLPTSHVVKAFNTIPDRLRFSEKRCRPATAAPPSSCSL
ncbi:MAG: NADP oxidoreductase, partial [Ilumatobacteraceae bacterium]